MGIHFIDLLNGYSFNSHLLNRYSFNSFNEPGFILFWAKEKAGD